MSKGKHLLLEGYIEKKNILDNTVFIRRLFKKIIKLAKMRPVTPIYFYRFPAFSSKIKGGLTAFVVLAESHLSIHTWPEKNYFTLDLFSCGDFKEKLILENLKKELALKSYQFRILRRGLRVKTRG